MQDGHKDPGLKNILDPINSHMCIVPLCKWLFIGVRSQEEHAYFRGEGMGVQVSPSSERPLGVRVHLVQSSMNTEAYISVPHKIYCNFNIHQGQCKMIFMVCLYVSTLENKKNIHNKYTTVKI